MFRLSALRDSMLGRMTDREKSILLGQYIINLRQQIIIYEAVFMEYRIETPYGPREFPFREKAREHADNEALKINQRELQDELLQGIGPQSEPSTLIQVLCNLFLKNN